MNREAIQKTIDAIKAERVGDKRVTFDMSDWYRDEASSVYDDEDVHECGTAACIAGFAVLANCTPEVVEKVRREQDWKATGACVLGLNYCDQNDTINYLFTPPGLRMSRITRDEAVQTLEGLLYDGKVDWSHVL